MKIYFAPLEGITGYIYRNAYNDFFGKGVDKYFTPFIAVSSTGMNKSRVWEDIKPEHNEKMNVVPQLLGNDGKAAADYISQLGTLGYKEVNINLGCPYQTVVAKRKGAGILAEPILLDTFLDDMFNCVAGRGQQIGISVKTRIGMESAEEFHKLLEIYNDYPISELIIHPRVRKDFYTGHPDWETFRWAIANSKAPLCYNGDIFTLKDYQMFREKFPERESVMLGRGPLSNPGLIQELCTGEKTEAGMIRGFHDRIYNDYRQVMSGDTNTLFKMKELWNYMQFLFEDKEKYIKKIRKAQKAAEYESAVNLLFANCPLKEGAGFEPIKL